MSFWDDVKALADKAPEAGFASFSYGQLSFRPMVEVWTEADGKRKKTAAPYVEGQALKDGQDAAFEFEVNIKEFNPTLDFNFTRLVTLKKSKVDANTGDVVIKTDWSETVLPSLITVFGANWMDEIRKSPYVQVEAVPQVNSKKTEGGRVYTTIKFIRKFANKEEAQAAHTAQFSKRDSETGESVPAVTGSIPQEAIDNARQLITNLGAENAAKALKGYPFGPYEPDDLIAAATAPTQA